MKFFIFNLQCVVLWRYTALILHSTLYVSILVSYVLNLIVIIRKSLAQIRNLVKMHF